MQVGDFIRGILIDGRREYGITNERGLCEILEIQEDGWASVKLVAHTSDWCFSEYEVELKYFEPCTLEQYLELYPNARLCRQLNKIKLSIKKENEKMELRMDKEKLGNYVFTDEERETLRTEIIDLLEEYDYNPTEYAINKILDEWVKNKGWMVELFKKHPNYNGKFQIVFDSDYSRCCNKDALYEFAYWMYYRAEEVLKVPVQKGKFSYEEVEKIYNNLCNVCDYIERIFNRGYQNISINGRSYEEMLKEKRKWGKKYTDYRYDDNVYISNGHAYDKAKYNMISKVYNFMETIRYYTEHLATEEFAEKINSYFPEIKAVAGQKTSRIVNKICKLIGIDKDPNYNREFAKYGDAINPLVIKRHTILSCHPIDYLTMSFGNSWASCHTIDKNNKRGMPDSYSGCYSSGTLSYMLDESSFVYYTVDKDYNGNKLELQDKINRNMFHMGEDKLIQARVYPQATDGETGIYRQIREIAQKVVADCLEVPNMWKNVKGTGACSEVISSYGTHYTDYNSFSDCNVSYLKGNNDEVNRNFIKVGHKPICPSCGDTHTHQEAIECEACYNDNVECHDCGYRYDTSDMHRIDGEWYCEDCCFYCEYHERWEVGGEDDYYYVNDYGKVCNDAFEYNDEFYTCERCGTYHYMNAYGDNHIETEDGKHFCCEECAERAGYVELGDEWYPEDEVYTCEHCGQACHEDSWNNELNCCEDCEDEVRAEIEETEEREAV